MAMAMAMMRDVDRGDGDLSLFFLVCVAVTFSGFFGGLASSPTRHTQRPATQQNEKQKK